MCLRLTKCVSDNYVHLQYTVVLVFNRSVMVMVYIYIYIYIYIHVIIKRFVNRKAIVKRKVL